MRLENGLNQQRRLRWLTVSTRASDAKSEITVRLYEPCVQHKEATSLEEKRENRRMVQAVIDSGAEISVVRERVAPEVKRSSGRVILTGAFRGQPERRSTPYTDESSHKLLNEHLGSGIDMLLTPDDYDNPRSGCGMPHFEPVNLEPEDEKDEEEALEAYGGCNPEDHCETGKQESTNDSERCGRRPCGFKIKPRDRRRRAKSTPQPAATARTREPTVTQGSQEERGGLDAETPEGIIVFTAWRISGLGSRPEQATETQAEEATQD
ncbi:hypothetical protein HPB47_009261 [Ixodes persulcatus]|uniref:Uncharacterized protein n=1 Tax=Ixodes persulcatus TaxID=34615 RepID=A0AC60P2G7_IXOPE|nr:hypothetical protein HPB47_009261 [Ixodes persulcatus]